jgi:hypothetical protein
MNEMKMMSKTIICTFHNGINQRVDILFILFIDKKL